MPYRGYEDQNCSIARTLAIVGERWTLLVLREVLLGRRRFRDIQRQTGVAPNILSDRLETLVEHGVLKRRGQDYVPTRKGLDLQPVLLTLMAWGDRYVSPHGPPRVAIHTACGHDAQAHLVCSHCGEPIDSQVTEIRAGPGADAKRRPAARRRSPSGAG
jgi:DNA-binding HxlR family transcriptional regulator